MTAPPPPSSLGSAMSHTLLRSTLGKVLSGEHCSSSEAHVFHFSGSFPPERDTVAGSTYQYLSRNTEKYLEIRGWRASEKALPSEENVSRGSHPLLLGPGLARAGSFYPLIGSTPCLTLAGSQILTRFGNLVCAVDAFQEDLALALPVCSPHSLPEHT